MHFGVEMFPTDYAMPVTELARAVEERGFESLWFPEHTHIPTSRRSPWPGGSELPKEYSHTLDPFAAFAIGPLVKAVQFHPEFDADVIRGYLHARAEIIRGEGHDPEALLARVHDGTRGRDILRNFAKLVSPRTLR